MMVREFWDYRTRVHRMFAACSGLYERNGEDAKGDVQIALDVQYMPIQGMYEFRVPLGKRLTAREFWDYRSGGHISSSWELGTP